MGSPLSGGLSPSIDRSIDRSISASAAAGIWAGADDAVAATARGCSGGAWAVGCATLLRCSCSKLSIFEFTSLIISASAPIWLCMKEIAIAWLCSVLSHCCCSACAARDAPGWRFAPPAEAMPALLADESSWLSSASSNPTGFECVDADACESFSPPVLPLADAAESALATDARDGEAALLLRLMPSPLETPLGEPLVFPPAPLRSKAAAPTKSIEPSSPPPGCPPPCTADVMLLRRAMLRPVLTDPRRSSSDPRRPRRRGVGVGVLSMPTPLPTGCNLSVSLCASLCASLCVSMGLAAGSSAAGLPEGALALSSALLRIDASCSSGPPLAGGLWLFPRRATPSSRWRPDPSMSGAISAPTVLARALLDATDASGTTRFRGNGGARNAS